MALASFIDSALSEFESDHDSPKITYKGNELVCVPANANTAIPLEVDGFTVEVDLVLIVRKNTLATKPIAGEHFDYNGGQYRIVRVTEPAVGSHWEVSAKDINQS